MNHTTKLMLELSTATFEYNMFKLNQLFSFDKRGKEPCNGKPIVLVPGFSGHERTLNDLKSHLKGLGHPTVTWGQGINKGLNKSELKGLVGTVEDLYLEYGKPVTLIGHSLGGVYSRLAANKLHTKGVINQVITLASPHTTDIDTNPMLRAILVKVSDMLSVKSDKISIDKLLSEESKFKYTSLYTKTDGVLNWENCTIPYDSDNTKNIEVRSSHISMIFNTKVYQEIESLLKET